MPSNSDDDDYMHSFGSQAPSSDGHEEMLAILAEQMKVKAEKKQKEKEKAFLKAAENTLDRQVDKAVANILSTREALDEMTSRFVAEHAIIEDEIRKLWVKVAEESNRRTAIARQRRAIHTALIEQTHTAHIEGMSNWKSAHDETVEIIQDLTASFSLK